MSKALLASISFHHSNLRLPLGVERWLCRLIVTPRLHGNHHSFLPEELNSNWSSGYTLRSPSAMSTGAHD